MRAELIIELSDGNVKRKTSLIDIRMECPPDEFQTVVVQNTLRQLPGFMDYIFEDFAIAKANAVNTEKPEKTDNKDGAEANDDKTQA